VFFGSFVCFYVVRRELHLLGFLDLDVIVVWGGVLGGCFNCLDLVCLFDLVWFRWVGWWGFGVWLWFWEYVFCWVGLFGGGGGCGGGFCVGGDWGLFWVELVGVVWGVGSFCGFGGVLCWRVVVQLGVLWWRVDGGCMVVLAG